MDSENSLEPDSTTLERDLKQIFTAGEDVLCLNSKDGCYYLGTIVQVDTVFKKCLVKFLDNTQTWSLFKDLKSFSFQESEITCVVCKKSQSKTDNEIIVCKCGRGYHQFCHQPKIPNNCGTDWKCKRCVPSTKRIDDKVSSDRILTPLYSQPSVTESLPTTVSQLPYNPDSLTWDVHHRINQEGYYCYCGGKGSWHMNMLQCRRCRQWFHAKCAPSVQQPVFCGDRFFVFLCSLCNQGKEYCRRLAMKWPDLVHLVLYNLTFKHQTKYYDLEDSIMPYIDKHWDDLKLPPWMSNALLGERKRNVLNSLISCEKRFKCGREIKKRNNLWGLRFRGPPKPPPLTLPPRGPIDDDVLKIYCKKNFVVSELEYKPLQNGHVNSSNYYGKSIGRPSTERKIVPPLIINVPKPHSTSVMELRVNVNKVSPSKETKMISSTEYHGQGLVKRSTPFPVTEQSTNLDSKFRSQAVRRATRLLNKKKKENMAAMEKKGPKEALVRVENNKKDFASSFKEFVENRKRNLDKETFHEPEIRRRPQRNLLEARLNSTESKLYNGNVVAEQEVKKKTCVDSKPTESNKKCKSLVSNKKNSVRLKPKKKSDCLTQRTITEAFKPKLASNVLSIVNKYDYYDKKSNESDTSVDDDTSSRGTLEPFIPTPKDLEGRNNPFRSVCELLGTQEPPRLLPITLPLPLKTVIPNPDPPRLMKRKLSEKDIRIDRNGQVKRRRRHRRTVTPTKQAILPINKQMWSGTFTINGRQLRNRERKPQETIGTCTITTPIKYSPNKDSPIVVEDLESSVKYLFGAASRIANGERYEIRAKRVTKDGQVQCILEWIGGPTP